MKLRWDRHLLRGLREEQDARLQVGRNAVALKAALRQQICERDRSTQKESETFENRTHNSCCKKRRAASTLNDSDGRQSGRTFCTGVVGGGGDFEPVHRVGNVLLNAARA